MARGTGGPSNTSPTRGNRRAWALASALNRAGIGEATAITTALEAGDIKTLLSQLIDPTVDAPDLQLQALALVDALWHNDLADYLVADRTLASAIAQAGYVDSTIAGPLTLLAVARLACVYGTSAEEFVGELRMKQAALPEWLARTVKIN